MNADDLPTLREQLEAHDLWANKGLGQHFLLDLNIAVAEQNEEFFADAADGSVIGVSIAPRAGGDAVDCTNGCTALEGDTADPEARERTPSLRFVQEVTR